MDDNVTPATDTARSAVSLEKEAGRLQRMVNISQLLNSTLDLTQLLDTIIKTASELLETQDASIMLVEQRTGELFFAASTGMSREEVRKIKVPIEGSIAGTIYTSGEPIITGDVSTDNRHYAGVDRSISFKTQSLLGVPLEVRTRRIGVLEAINKLNGESFTQEDVEILSTLASHAAIAIDNARLVANLREANRQLSELDRLKTNFISIASHELRTPLMIVQGFASFLRDQASEDMSNDLDMVLKGASKLQAIIDQMTNLNYLESGSGDLRRETFAVQDLVNELDAEWQSLAAAKQQTLSVSAPPYPIDVRGDRAKMALALSNLLNNAVKFTNENGSIRIEVIPHTGRVEIAVVDNGVGIPKAELNRIFDRFYQVEDHLTRHHGGLGLGLAIAKEVVEQHNGRIWAESVQGKGSRFRIILPAMLSERKT